MAKRKSKNFYNKWWFWLFVFLFLSLIAVLIWGVRTDWTFVTNEVEFTGTPIEELPEQLNLDCSYYNLRNEFYDFFGASLMKNTKDTCETAGAWTETYNEVSCIVPDPPISVDCNQDFLVHSKNLCERLNANDVCDEATGVIGCFCKDVPEPVITQEEFTCGQTWDEFCEGTCPSTHPDCVELEFAGIDNFYTACACINEENQDVHEDWKPEGENHNPKPEPTTSCEDVRFTPPYGDLDPICQEADCSTGDCHHYWWYNALEHRCGCTETFFCGQYCFEYLYTIDCDCPPDSFKEIVTRSTFRCVPNGYTTCEGSTPV